MISFTAKITKARFFTAIAVILIPLLIFSAVYISRAAENKKQVVLAGATAEQRAAFLKQYGWEIDSSDETVKDTVIPSVFDNVYDAYNSIQVSQGLTFRNIKARRLNFTI